MTTVIRPPKSAKEQAEGSASSDVPPETASSAASSSFDEFVIELDALGAEDANTWSSVEREAQQRLRQELSAKIGRCDLELPLLPQVAGQVLAMAADERSDASALSSLIHQDQAVAGHVLRFANSAAFGGSTRVVSLQQAVARLGLDFLAEVILAASVRSKVFRVPGFESVTQQMWRMALSSGIFAKEIARIRKRNVETAFLCGLLNNIGRPVVLKAAVDLRRALKLGVPPAGVLALVEELHGQAGALIAVKWSLPKPVLESIIYCGTGKGAPSFLDEALTSRLANCLGSWALAPSELSEREVRELPAVAALNLYPDDLSRILEKREATMKAVESMAL